MITRKLPLSSLIDNEMTMRVHITHTNQDVATVRELVERPQLKRRIDQRRAEWATSDAAVTPESVWYAVIACLVTTQQRSGDESHVGRFLRPDTFPLGLAVCRENAGRLEEFIIEVL